jgi:hypothetical protein
MSKVKAVREYLFEDVNIPPELAQQYLSVKKQIVDKQSKKANLMKSVNQIENEMNILNKNIIAIESKAAELTGQEEENKIKNQKEVAQQQANVAQQQAQQAEVAAPTTESIDIDDWWRKNVSEELEAEPLDLELMADEDEDFDIDDEVELIDEPLEPEEGESLEGDYVFTLKVDDEDEEEPIIAKFYKNEDDDFWRVRVVQGSEDPLEKMQFDPDMEMLDIIEELATLYDDVEEIDTQEYQDLLDDKEIIDDIYYDDILQEE